MVIAGRGNTAVNEMVHADGLQLKGILRNFHNFLPVIHRLLLSYRSQSLTL